MKERNILCSIVAITSMLTVMIIPIKAWEYYDTTIANPQTDNTIEQTGPKADRIQINMYSNELAEFTALELGQIDVTDWPVDSAHYGPWTTPGMNGDPGYQDRIAVVDTGPEFGLYILDMRMDNRTLLDDGSANPALNANNGNPMASIALRRAIASICDRYYAVNTIISGGSPPPLAAALYTPLSDAYGSWCHPEIKPTGALAQWCYVLANESANVAGGLAWLTATGYTYDAGADATKDPTGYQFTIDFYYRIDHTYRSRFATEVIQYYLELAPPNGLGMRGNLVMHGVTSAGARQEVMADKKGHMYTGGWGLTIDPDHLYYLFSYDGYWHPGRPLNYMHYPACGNLPAKVTVPSDGWYYTGFPEAKWNWTGTGLDFSDPDKEWNAGDEVWMNPANYWSWEMMIAATQERARHAALKCQEFLAFWVCGVPLWASKSYSAFHRTYTGAEVPYGGQPWMGVVNQKGFGVWSKMSFYNMHTANALWGDGQNMTIRWGFRQPTMSLNPLYAEGVWDWYVMNQCYDGLVGIHPYTLENIQSLATNWNITTWDSPDYGTCTKILLNLRHDIKWSDEWAFTASDVKFSWGGPLVTGSISNLLEKMGYPPTYWSSNIADILSIATPDPWTVIVYLDVYACFGLHSMSGFNIVLPEHIWKPIIETGDPTQPWDQPYVCTGGYKLVSSADPGMSGTITLVKNPEHFHVSGTGYPENKPVNILTDPKFSVTDSGGNIGWIYPKLGQESMEIDVTVKITNKYNHQDGIHQQNTWPGTKLGGSITVTLWEWNQVPCMNQPGHYEYAGDIAQNELWEAWIYKGDSIPYEHTYHIPDLQPNYYKVKVDVLITNLWVSTGLPGGPYWQSHDGDNPYYGYTDTYSETEIGTSKYDICGAFWSPCPDVGTPRYQSVPDLKVDVKDLYACGKAYGTAPGYSNWNIAADVNDDLKVDVKDYYKIAQNYGWTAPP